MNIINLLQKKNNLGRTPLSFDTKSSTPSNNAFVIRRESDNAEQAFNYTEITDGTFDTFVTGSEGAIKEWIGSDGSILKNTVNANQPRLKSNSGNPFVDDYSQEAALLMTRTIDMSQDSIISVILKDELNPNNQRANIIIRGSGNNLFAMQLTATAGNVLYNRPEGGVGDYGFSYSNDGVFKLMTFERRGGVNKFYINNTEITTTAASGTYTIWTADALENQVILGSRNQSTAGKITKYQHLGVIVGEDATNLNISDYNTFLMVKYGM
jgi:hypothetical protein